MEKLSKLQSTSENIDQLVVEKKEKIAGNKEWV